MRVLWAYLADVSADRVAQLLRQSLPALRAVGTVEFGERLVTRFDGDRCKATIEISLRPAFPMEVEVTLHDDLLGAQFGQDSMAFGEWLVDNLACTAVVDCGGRHVPAFSDYLIRITADSIESVAIPDDMAMIDESKTSLVKTGR
jgi:hypothetical protein